MDQLNPQQIKAVTTVGGPVLIVAGPGSGKTKVLTHRVAFLIKEKEINPENILAVTFTNKAAGEMRERVVKLLETGSYRRTCPCIGTFHSICSKILRQEINRLGYKKNFVIYDEDDQKRLIKEVMKELEIDTQQFTPSRVLHTISAAKDELINTRDYEEQAFDYFQESISKIYKNYQVRLKANNALDFDDLISITIELFRKHPKVLNAYQKRFQYILVDEYQDTNSSQYVFVNLLAQNHKNIFVIGDIDQSIYGWRGADFRNILNFEKDYPETKVIILKECYRCTKNILNAAQNIISKNNLRKEKILKSRKPKGNLITIYKADNEKREAKFIARKIKNLTYEGALKLKDFVVLYRTNAQSRALEEAFLKYGIFYKITGGIRFYARREVKDILAYLKLIQNPKDEISLKRIINVPPRRKNKKIENFDALISQFRQLSLKYSVTKLIHFILNEIDYEDYVNDGTKEGRARWENVLELLTVAKEYNHLAPPQGLRNFLEEVSLLTNADGISSNKEVVNLMTLHCAKGLEFKAVFIAGCEEGLLPHSLSQTQEELEEERRLIYVGITRAKERVFLTYTDQRNLYGSTLKNIPSEFLKDIPRNLVKCCGFDWEEL